MDFAIRPRPTREIVEAAGCGYIISGASLAVGGLVTLFAGAIVCAVAKKGGYYGDKIHNIELWKKGYITTFTGLGALMIGLSGTASGAAAVSN